MVTSAWLEFCHHESHQECQRVREIISFETLQLDITPRTTVCATKNAFMRHTSPGKETHYNIRRLIPSTSMKICICVE